MPHKPLALLLALTAGNAFAAASHFSDAVPEKADNVPLAYIGTDSTAATGLTLSYAPTAVMPSATCLPAADCTSCW